jgi:hypothetical protein
MPTRKLDPYTLRSARRLMLKLARREREKDANRPAHKAESMYWVGASDAYEYAAIELLAREKRALTKQSRKPTKRKR